MGAEAFDDPRKFPNHKYGEIFIHELVHACQIQHSNMDLILFARVFSTKLCGDPHAYGPAGPASDFISDFGIEQQAQIVQDWFAGNKRDGTNQTGKAMDKYSPYFRFIYENIRTGNL